MKTCVFIVDDHPLVRRGLAAILEAEPDMQICGEAEDTATAIQLIKEQKPELAIVDISLRGNSGIELIKAIRLIDPSIQVIVLSMHDESVYALRVLKAGARGYVMKQDVAEKILDAIRRVRKGQLFVSDHVATLMLNHFVGAKEGGELDSPVHGLSDRELEVVNLIGSGTPTREIASRMHISLKTVETHRMHIKRKLDLRNATQLVQFCVRWVEESRSSVSPF